MKLIFLVSALSAFYCYGFQSTNLGTYKIYSESLRKKNHHINKIRSKKPQHAEPLSSGEVLSPEFYKSVYVREVAPNDGEQISDVRTTPWDNGGRPQPAIVRAYEDGKLRGRIVDAGCGEGENCIYLASKFGISSLVGFDFAEGAIVAARARVAHLLAARDGALRTVPEFHVGSCTDIARPGSPLLARDDGTEAAPFDASIDSGLLHCLSHADSEEYVRQMARLVKKSGRAFVGCFSTANPDPWQNPRRLSEDYLKGLFCTDNGWEVVDIQETWWSRPPARGSSQGAFCQALWMEARRL